MKARRDIKVKDINIKIKNYQKSAHILISKGTMKRYLKNIVNGPSAEGSLTFLADMYSKA